MSFKFLHWHSLSWPSNNNDNPQAVSRSPLLEDTFVGPVEKQTRFTREQTDQIRVGVYLLKVLLRASAIRPAAFNASENDEFLPLPQPRLTPRISICSSYETQPVDDTLLLSLAFACLYHAPLQDFNALLL